MTSAHEHHCPPLKTIYFLCLIPEICIVKSMSAKRTVSVSFSLNLVNYEETPSDGLPRQSTIQQLSHHTPVPTFPGNTSTGYNLLVAQCMHCFQPSQAVCAPRAVFRCSPTRYFVTLSAAQQHHAASPSNPLLSPLLSAAQQHRAAMPVSA